MSEQDKPIMKKIICPVCGETLCDEWTESDAAYHDEDWIPNSYFCYECGEVFQPQED